jgi:5-methylcytosine-specific restriction protein A
MQLLALVEPGGHLGQTDSAFNLNIIAPEIAMAELSEISARTVGLLDRDLSASAMEGLTEEQKIKVRRRAAWLADRYISDKMKSGGLFCEECGFDPAEKTKGTSVKSRSLLDVHHKHPLDEGVRRTTLLDFCLLCPTCHRFAHALARSQTKQT